ncbi:TIGR04141 family sporadically distributed protein, partial [Salmonella enterica]|nr:TIGR04141 family sporadically distributed protein [Salmonella enterica]
ELTKKIIKEGLVEQKTILHQSYQLKFYFSDKLKGNEVWWWDVFSDFFNEEIEKPHNIFYFGLLIGFKEKDPENCYLISLGKSHFYLSKFIEADFGLNVAMRIANDENILLKKSRFFCGGKSQEASSYSQFVQGAYFPGESIEHLKTKAKETDKWGCNNITFSDSIQLSLDGAPTALVDVFNDIDSSLATKEKIEFPKSEKITDESKIDELDNYLLQSIITDDAKVIIDEIQSFGASIVINNSLTFFKLHTKVEGSGKYLQSSDKINDIKIADVKKFIKNNNIKDVNKVFVK